MKTIKINRDQIRITEPEIRGLRAVKARIRRPGKRPLREASRRVGHKPPTGNQPRHKQAEPELL